MTKRALGLRLRPNLGVRPRLAALARILGCASLLSACTSVPVYRERGPGESVGYTDMRLTENRVRVTYAGGNATRREEVEDFLLRRAAEVTLDSGYSHFVFDARDTSAETYYRNTFGPRTRLGVGFGSYGPSPWYYSRFAFGDPFYGNDLSPVTHFEAYSEIVMLQPGQAAGDPFAVDAREVLAALNPPPAPPQS
jgi:hypothetical protein